jgi:hypothetical protein
MINFLRIIHLSHSKVGIVSSWLKKSWRNNIKGGTKGKVLKILPKYQTAPNYTVYKNECSNFVD